MKISKAMRAYLQRAKDYDAFMEKEKTEYEIGRRHLANMMGADPENFTQDDIDKAIEYLMPSGLFEPKARPILKPPEEIFPKKKAAEFDVMGRPFHCFFYTGRPNYYQLLHEIAANLEGLNAYEDDMWRKGFKNPTAEHRAVVSGTDWISKDKLENTIVEKLRDEDHTYFISCLTRLASHSYSARVQDFILKFRRKLVAHATTMEIPPLSYDEAGRPYVEMEGKRKRSLAKVVVRGSGTGKVEINGQDITYFKVIQSREVIMFPLQFTGLLGSIDLEAIVSGPGGESAEAGAIRYATALALRSFLTTQETERMRLAGLLTRDPRDRERKKTGQKGARAKYTWKKR